MNMDTNLELVASSQERDFGTEDLYGKDIPTPIYDKIIEDTATLEAKSNYKSNFDHTVYRDLELRFSDTPARGGFIFKTPLKLANHHSSCSKCHYSFELDSYGRGCFHNCVYCYAKESLTAHKYWNEPQPFPISVTELHKIFYTVFETDKSSKWREILEKKVPLRIGSMSDSFMKMDIKYGITKEVLKILSHYNYPYVIFTRSDVVARDEYIKELRKDLCSIQFSMSGNEERITKMIEPGAPSVQSRFAALKKLNAAGFWTTVRINPFFPMKPDGYYTNPDVVIEKFGSLEAAPSFDLFDWSMLDQLKEAKVPSFLVGVVRLSPHAIRAMEKSLNIPLAAFFNNTGASKAHDFRYSEAEVSHYYREFYREARKRQLRYGTCFIGMGLKDYYQYQDMWSNKSDCCDAKGNVSAIKSSSQDVNWDIRIKHAPRKEDALKTMTEERATHDYFTENPPKNMPKLEVVRDVQA